MKKLILILVLIAGTTVGVMAQQKAPKGAINGRFSVSANEQVYFSKGNLQYQASTNTWRFATRQWDIIGEDNKSISSSYSGWIDLFGWGTGNAPTKASIDNDDYAENVDWGNHGISNADGGFWCSLTHNEWSYVFEERKTPSGIRYAKARVNNINGVILLPDNWSSSYYKLNNTNTTSGGFSNNVISSSVWTNSFEKHGAIFLPAAGHRFGSLVSDVGSCGYYWSASDYNGWSAYRMRFDDNYFCIDRWDRDSGKAVRLVYSNKSRTLNGAASPSTNNNSNSGGSTQQKKTVTVNESNVRDRISETKSYKSHDDLYYDVYFKSGQKGSIRYSSLYKHWQFCTSLGPESAFQSYSTAKHDTELGALVELYKAVHKNAKEYGYE